MQNSSEIGALLLVEATAEFRKQKDLSERAVVQVSDEQLHQPLDPNTNSIAVIMKHMGGNLVSRWSEFLTTDGEKPGRRRDNEFVDDITSRDALMTIWESGWQCMFTALSELTADDLIKTVAIRGEPHTVVRAIDRSLTHLAYHVGQIVLIARIHAGENWTVLTIPPGESEEFNRRTWVK